MSKVQIVELPDIGDFDEVEIIEILVNVGDTINADDSIITLESDKASMEIPSPHAGTITQMHVNLGDKISQGSIILSLEGEGDADDTADETPSEPVANEAKIIAVNVPDIGDFDAVEVIEILTAEGENLGADDSIITLESDKASMEIPTPVSGVVKAIHINLGDKVSQGEHILDIETTDTQEPTSTQTGEPQVETVATTAPTPPPAPAPQPAGIDQSQTNVAQGQSHASPSIRKLARELGVDLANVAGSGQKGRVLESDLKSYVKKIMLSGGTGSAIPKIPTVDFSKFGEIEIQALSRINKISGKHLSACWLNIPHVTQFDEVNIDQMEALRQEQKAQGVKLTPLVYIMKAVVQALKQHPRFNASLDESGENLIIKKYYNLGIAVDTPNGLMVPVIKDVDSKSLTELASELGEISARAREGKLSADELQGAGFSISSLGGIGGTQFTPIVNAPEVAILGVSRSKTQPVWNGESFEPALTLPLALSYDHRVIDGAQGARFMADLNAILTDIQEIGL